jgi:hypothetical protein
MAAQNNDGSAPKTRGRPFQPGQSGNPGGRPKVLREVQALAAEHSEAAIAKLVEIMTSKDASHSSQIEAAKVLLERAWGKPAQPIEHSVPEGSFTRATLRELTRELLATDDDPILPSMAKLSH